MYSYLPMPESIAICIAPWSLNDIVACEVSLNLRALVSLFSVFVEINKAENAIITMYIKTKFVSEIFFLKIPFLQASYIKYFFVRHV